MNNRQPLVSIAIASYQHERFLKECLDSVLSQTYKNIEVIVVDDGSTDGSQDIIREYASKHNNFKIALFPFNKGVAYTQLKMLELSTGEYMCIFDGDDLMYPEKIEKQVDFLERNTKYQMCFHDVMVFDDDTQMDLYKWSEKYAPANCAKEALFQANQSSKGKPKRTPSGSKFGRTAYIKNGITDTRTSGRIEFMFFLGMEATHPDAPWYTLPEVLGVYRLHDHNISRQEKSWQKNAEETIVTYALAKIKFPKYIKDINREETNWWFNEMLYNPSFPANSRQYYLKEFRRNFGVIKYIHLSLFKFYLKIVRTLKS